MARDATSGCSRRLSLEFRGGGRAPSASSQARWSTLNAVRSEITAAHSRPGPVTLSTYPQRLDLTPEERATYHRAIARYVALFGDVGPGNAQVTLSAYDTRTPTVIDELGVALTGGLDLVVEGFSGECEVRQIHLGGRDAGVDGLKTSSMWALLRLADWLGDRSVRVVVVDLARESEPGGLVVGSTAERIDAMSWLTTRLAILRERTSHPKARAGLECGWCRHARDCPIVA